MATSEHSEPQKGLNKPKGCVRPRVSIPGLTACRLAAALSEKEVARLMDSYQAAIRYAPAAECYILRRLCRELKVWPLDLMDSAPVEEVQFQDDQRQRAQSVFERERAERRRQVNRIKRQRAVLTDSSAVRLAGLKARRLEAELTQRELARLASTNQSTIYELEKKYTSRGAYMKTIRKLCQALGVSPADLICK